MLKQESWYMIPSLANQQISCFTVASVTVNSMKFTYHKNLHIYNNCSGLHTERDTRTHAHTRTHTHTCTHTHTHKHTQTHTHKRTTYTCALWSYCLVLTSAEVFSFNNLLCSLFMVSITFFSSSCALRNCLLNNS